MGIGISSEAAELWKAFDETSYNEMFVEEDGDYVFFAELPDWAYDPDEGPFYVIDDSIYAVGMTPSQEGALIGNLTD